MDITEESSRAEQTAILAACHEEQESLPCLPSLEEEVDTGEETEQVEDQSHSGIHPAQDPSQSGIQAAQGPSQSGIQAAQGPSQSGIQAAQDPSHPSIQPATTEKGKGGKGGKRGKGGKGTKETKVKAKNFR